MLSGYWRFKKEQTFHRKDWAVLLGLMALSSVYYFTFYRYGLNLSDEGYVVHGAIRVLGGELPGADFHSYAPGRTWLLGLLYQITGVSISTERLMWIVWRAVTSCLLWVLSRRFLEPRSALLVVLASLFMPGPWHKTPLVFSLALVSLLLLALLRETRRARLFPLGAGLGSILLIREEVGLLGVGLGFVVVGCRLRSRSGGVGAVGVAAVAGGVALTLTLGAIPYFLQGRLLEVGAFYFSELLRTASGVSATGSPGRVEHGLHVVTSVSRPFLEGMLYGLPLLLVAVSCALILLRRAWRSALGQEFMLFSAVSAFCALILHGQPDLSHLLQVFPFHHVLALLLLSQGFGWLSSLAPSHRRVHCFLSSTLPFTYTAMVFALVLASGIGDPYYTGSALLRADESVELQVHGDLLYVERDRAEVIRRTVEVIRRNTVQGEPIFVFPYAPMFYVLADRPNPTSFDGVFAHLPSEAGFEEGIVQALQNSDVRVVVVDRGGVSALGWPTGSLKAYLDKRFLKTASFGPYEVFSASSTP